MTDRKKIIPEEWYDVSGKAEIFQQSEEYRERWRRFKLLEEVQQMNREINRAEHELIHRGQVWF